MDHERSRITVWSFLKNLFKVVIGLSLLVQSLLFLVLLVLAIGIVGGISSSLSGGDKHSPSVTVPDGGALVLNPVGVLVEVAPPADPLADALAGAFGDEAEAEIPVHDLVEILRNAQEDDRVGALVLDLQGLYISKGDASKAHYLASAVEAFRASGKPVVAVGDIYSQEQYLIASEADTILLHDQGSLILDGYSAYGNYFASLLEKLKVTTHIFRVGTFKSAVEPFMRDDMSPEAKEANRVLIGSLWDQYAEAIAENRAYSPDDFKGMVETYADRVEAAGGNWARAALQNRLVDQLLDRQGQIDFIAEIVGREDNKTTGFKGIGYKGYRLTMDRKSDRPSVDDVAVITVAGAIVDGDEPVGVAAGDRIARQLREAREKESVKAVVLRVDSPGGSAFASEIIRDELLALKGAGKPVVVSMGSYAASGGYWISANADEIWASPTTITGSIGVFGLVTTFEDSLAEIGVSTDGVGTTPLSGLRAAGAGPLPEPFARMLQASVEATYDEFLGLVAEGRGMTKAQVDSIGQGRVWPGARAKELGLVDSLGELDDATAAAARRASLDEYDVIGMSEEKTRFEVFLEQLTGTEAEVEPEEAAAELFATKVTDTVSLGRIVAAVREQAETVGSFNDPNAIYVRCTGCGVR